MVGIKAVGYRDIKLTRLRLGAELFDDFDLYKRAYRDEHGDEIDDADLIVALVGMAIEKDRDFQKYKKAHESRAPILDARLPDGARVNAAIPPVAVGGAKATIRPYRRVSFSYEDLEELGTAPPELRSVIVDGIASGLNVVISGGTGSGKTAFLRAITQFFRPGERVIVIEDTNENIVPNHDHVVAFEAAKRVGEDDRVASVTMDTLIANALRCRPDRIVVGEIRKSPAAAAYLEAINTGHGGCLTTTHANGAVDTLRRISNLLAWSTSSGISSETIDRLVSQNTDLIIHIRKVYEGATYRRRVTEVLKIGVSGEQEFIIS